MVVLAVTVINQRSDLQLSVLDTVFVSSKRVLPQPVIARTAKALRLEDKQVG